MDVCAGNFIPRCAYGTKQGFRITLFGLAQVGFDFTLLLLNGIQVGTVGRQVPDLGPSGLNKQPDTGIFVHR